MKGKNKVILAVSILLLITTHSCKYTDFLPYYKHTSSKDHLPNIGAKQEKLGENGPFRSNFDVTCYDWQIDVDQEKKSVKGTMKIDFIGMQKSNLILLDMDKRLKILQISSTLSIKKYTRKGSALYINFENDFEQNERVTLNIDYQGKPAIIAKEGPIQWRRDSLGRHWVSTLTQGIGSRFLMPCKDLLVDSPDSCFIRVSSVTNQFVSANGRLIRKDTNQERHVYHYAVYNPINIYNISFNIGSYQTFSIPYKSIDKEEYSIEVVALDYHESKARNHYKQLPTVMHHLEELWGVYPFWNDGCKIVESTFSAMEHQSAIAMGSSYFNHYKGYNLQLVHEISHEWWGNYLNVSDYADIWMHEGFAVYNEALFLERKFGKEAFNVSINRAYSNIKNQRALLKRKNVRYNSWVHDKDKDVYNKGCMVLHTIRKQFDNDAQFFNMLSEALSKFGGNKSWTTEDFKELTRLNSSRDLTGILNFYLSDIEIPTLLIKKGGTEDGTEFIEYKWDKNVPEDFNLHVYIKINSEFKVIAPNQKLQTLLIPKNSNVEIDPFDSGYMAVENISVR